MIGERQGIKVVCSVPRKAHFMCRKVNKTNAQTTQHRTRTAQHKTPRAKKGLHFIFPHRAVNAILARWAAALMKGHENTQHL